MRRMHRPTVSCPSSLLLPPLLRSSTLNITAKRMYIRTRSQGIRACLSGEVKVIPSAKLVVCRS